MLCLFDEIVHRNAPVVTAHLRDNTVGAAFVAALCNLQIRIAPAGGIVSVRQRSRQIVYTPDTLHNTLFLECIAKCRSHLLISHRADDHIHLRDLGPDLLMIPLCQTACCHK